VFVRHRAGRAQRQERAVRALLRHDSVLTANVDVGHAPCADARERLPCHELYLVANDSHGSAEVHVWPRHHCG
jgi:hypothetical protein